MTEEGLANGEARSDAFAADVFKDVSAVAIGSITTVWTPASGKRIRWLGATISASAGVSILFEDNSNAAENFLFRTPVLVANVPYEIDLGPRGLQLSAVDRVLKATSSGAANLTGTFYGVEK